MSHQQTPTGNDKERKKVSNFSMKPLNLKTSFRQSNYSETRFTPRLNDNNFQKKIKKDKKVTRNDAN